MKQLAGSSTTRHGSSQASNGFAVRCVNLQKVLNLLHDGRPVSSPELGRLLGVHPPTVTRLTAVLEEARLVASREDHTSKSVGRPPKVWRLNTKARYALGLAIHPMALRGVLVDLAGHTIARRTFSYDPPLTADQLPGAVTDIVNSVLGRTPTDRVLGVGAGISGVVDPEAGVVRISGGLFTKPGTFAIDYPLRAQLEDLMPWPVQVVNDANLGALAVFRRRVRLGELRPDASLVYLMAVESLWGFGGGVIVGGRLHPGVRGAAGEILHPSLLAQPPGWGDAPARALAGDQQAVDQVLVHLQPVLEHFAALALTLDPDCVVLGGALATLGQPLRDTMADLMTRAPGFGQYLAELPSVGLVLDHLWPDTIAVGAAELVLEDLFREPELGRPGPLVRLAMGASSEASGGRAASLVDEALE